MLRVEGENFAVMNHLSINFVLIQYVHGLLDGAMGRSPSQQNILGMTGGVDFRGADFPPQPFKFLHSLAYHLIAHFGTFADVAFFGMFIAVGVNNRLGLSRQDAGRDPRFAGCIAFVFLGRRQIRIR